MEVKISFSDFFNVAPKVLEAYGAFDVSLINDLPLFNDPFLLFDSKDDEYQSLNEDIIRYVIFLRDVSVIHHSLCELKPLVKIPDIQLDKTNE